MENKARVDGEEIFSTEAVNEEGTRSAARQIFNRLTHNSQFNRYESREVILLNGHLGAGKTFMARELLQLWGVEEPVTSPTFNLMHVFEVNDFRIIHADFYRLNHERELVDLDIFDYILELKTGLILIEWGERFPSLRREATLEIFLEPISEEGRKVRVIQH